MINQVYASDRFSLLPLRPNTKIASLKNWQSEQETLRGFHIKLDDLGPSAGVRCGVQYGDEGYLVVIDFDDVNKMTELSKKLEEKNFFLPETFTVRTKRGFHYYFVVDEIPPKRKFKYFDLQGQSSYVVAAGCPHPDGGVYEIEDENIDYIEKLPDFERFLELTEEFCGKTLGELAAGAGENPLNAGGEVQVGGRDDFIFKKACQLRSLGGEFETILPMLLDFNKRLCSPPLTEAEVRIKAGSACKYAPDKAKTLMEDEVAPISVPQIIAHSPEEDRIPTGREVLNAASGALRTIAEDILLASPRQYESFAVASAVSIIGAAAQGSFGFPSFRNPGKISKNLNIFTWCVAPSAAGKDSYLTAVDKYVTAVCPFLSMGLSGSSHGFRSSMFVHNSRVSIVDEYQDELERLKNGGSYLAQILSDMKQLASNRQEMSSVALKNIVYPAVKFPYYSVFAVGTDSGFYNTLTGSAISDGFLSRFMVWGISKPVHAQDEEDIEELNIRPEIVKLLQKLFVVGAANKTFDGNDYQGSLDEFHAYTSDAPVGRGVKKDPLEHMPQHHAVIALELRKGVKELYNSYRREQERMYIEHNENHNSDGDLSPGSVADRAPSFAKSLAAIHCLGRGDKVISVSDMEFAILAVKHTSGSMQKQIKDRAYKNPFDKNRGILLRKIKEFKKKTPEETLNMRALSHGTRWLRSFERIQLLEELCTSGEIECYQKGAENPVDFTNGMPSQFKNGKFPYGCRFEV